MKTTNSIWGQASVWRSEKWKLWTQEDWDNPAYLPVWSHTVREVWVLREIVGYGWLWMKTAPLEGFLMTPHPTLKSRVLFTEWKNPVVMRGLCVLSHACEAERKPCQQGEGWGGELRHLSSQMWRWFYSLTRHCSAERGCQRAPGSKILHLRSI